MQPAPRTATEVASAQARSAWERGRAAMAAEEFATARRLFERACRLAPGDLTPRLSLAGACLATGLSSRAAVLFGEVAAAADARAAWLGAAVALSHTGNFDEAASALHQALSRHAGAGGEAVDAITSAAGYVGWCGLDPSGRLIGRAAGPLRLRMGGRTMPGAFGMTPPMAIGRLHVLSGGQRLLGSPILLDDIHRLEGVVEADAGFVTGWAWHPGNPARVPKLTLQVGEVRRPIRPRDLSIATDRPLTEPRGFRVAVDFTGPISVTGPDGTKLTGSPVILRPVATKPAAAAAPCALLVPTRPVAVVVPVYRGARETLACLRDVHATLPAGFVLIVVDDASPQPGLIARIEALGPLILLRHSTNRGFPAAANLGLRAALALERLHDVVLLNSDTRLAAGWLERLRASVHSAGDIGSATPLSNDASIASYPNVAGNPSPGPRELARLSQLAVVANPEVMVETPTGVGFCLYLRHECVAETGLLREDAFAQGYGEENDFCLRAGQSGWRHVIVPGAYVAHVGARSFGAARAGLLARNLRVLEYLHPGYRERIDRWTAADPLAAARRNLDRLRWADWLRREPRRGVLIVTHDHGGGTERCVQERIQELRAGGERPIIVRPVLDRREGPEASGRRTLSGLVRIDDPGFPNLVFRLPDEAADLAATLRAARPAAMEVHHMLGHDHAVLGIARRLAIPYDLRLHDYAAFCPRIMLTAPDRYCGEPDVTGCVACVAAHGSLLEEAVSPQELRARSAADLAGARQSIVPSADMATRMRRHFPTARLIVAAHEPDIVHPPLRATGDAPVSVVVVGAISRAKGYDVLLDCVRDAAARALKLRFVVVGHTIDDDALMAFGVEVTGPYREGEAAGLIAESRATIGFIPSLWPETWCLALSEILRAGLGVLAFDLGAQAERIRGCGRGWLLPLGAPVATINRALLCPPPMPTPLAASRNVMQTVNIRQMSQTPAMSEGTQ